MRKERAVECERLVLAPFAGGVCAELRLLLSARPLNATNQSCQEGEELRERLADVPFRQPYACHFDEDGVQPRADHPRHEGQLLALPQVRERGEPEALADVLNAQALVVGQNRA